jgi:hypothetical protein
MSSPAPAAPVDTPVLAMSDLIQFDPRHYIERLHNKGDQADTTFYQRYLTNLGKLPDINLDHTAGPWLAGGFCTRLLDGRDTSNSDFDIFFKSEQQFTTVLGLLITNGFAVTKTQPNSLMLTKGGVEVNLVTLEYFADIASVFNFFDLTISQVVITKIDGTKVTLVTTPLALHDISSKKLVINNVHHPVATLKRIVKYSKQDYNLCTGGAIQFLLCVAANPGMITESAGYID